MNKKFLSVAEAAELLGVSRATMYRYLQDKTIPAVKLGGNTWKISAKYLENLESEDKKLSLPVMMQERLNDQVSMLSVMLKSLSMLIFTSILSLYTIIEST